MGFFDQFGDFDGYLHKAMQDVFPGGSGADAPGVGYQPMPPDQPSQPQPAPPPFANVMPSHGGIGSDYAGAWNNPNRPVSYQDAMSGQSSGYGNGQPFLSPQDAQAAQQAREAAALRMRMATNKPDGDFQLSPPNGTPGLLPPSTNMMPQPRPDSAPPPIIPGARGIGSDQPPYQAPPQVPLPPPDPRQANAGAPPPPQFAPGPIGPPMDISPPGLGAGGLPPGMAPPRGPEANQGGFLQNVLGISPDRGSRIMAGIGKGMAGIQGSGALASFARGAGTAIGGAQTEGHTQYDQKLKALNAAINARKVGDMDAYKTNYLKYLGTKEQNRADTATNKPGAWNKPAAQRFVDAQNLFTKQQHALYLELGLNNKDMKPEDRVKALQQYTERSTKLQADILSGVGITPQDAANMAKNPPGTQPNPHAPSSKQDFDAYVKPGQFYKNPRDGKVYMRKTDAAPAGKEPSARPDEAPEPFEPGVPGSTGLEREAEPALNAA